MAFDIPTIEPLSHQAGVSLIFDRSLPDFPSDTWTLTYALRSATASAINLTASQVSGTLDFRVSVAGTTTVNWDAGDYIMIGYVTDGTNIHEVYRNSLTITAYAVNQTTYEWRTYARQMLDKVESVISGRIARDDASYSINGRTFTPKSDEDLLKVRDYFKAEVAKEERGGKQRRILARFRKPR